MANIAKKISFIIFSAVIVFFITGNSFANNDMLHKAAESTKNGVGHTENVMQDASNAVQNTANSIKDMSSNVVTKTEEQAKDFTNGVGEATTDMKNGVYNATRTATTAATSAFSNGTVWSWIIVVAVVLGIAFLIWYLVKRNHNE